MQRMVRRRVMWKGACHIQSYRNKFTAALNIKIRRRTENGEKRSLWRWKKKRKRRRRRM